VSGGLPEARCGRTRPVAQPGRAALRRPVGDRLRRALLAGVLAVLPVSCRQPEPVEQPLIMPDPSPFRYPVALWDQRVTGETVLLVHVTREGKVDGVRVFNGSGHADFDSAAVAGARKLRFVPGKRGTRPVDMWTKLPVRFALDSVAVGS
jgi:TonB family protein